MKHILLILAVALGLIQPSVSMAQGADAPAIQGVITSQLDAFLDEDVDLAWTFASPVIKGMFRTPENFGMMVKNGYPMVWQPTDTQYLELRDIEGAIWQKVQVRDTSGQYHLLDYKMVQTGDGTWLIDAVQFIKSVGVGV